ncbi:hypothetical protein MPTK1_5g01140 [Marchantia polymorpha subsp. ruderalis]|uniref:Mediator complex subunit 15 KIX domain-containing protein n=2 Tax=Marchantia polymorpha TaxID=3197 RepID=A0AAF6BDN0_MARPO|nr:hypothetical protein MARPO_0197s0008 [Marchantia polymorpha]PTQ27459.1 hypothetical protein MARPO_0197s0008 [Marchantia polymorpha]BBN10114.1 hypothetical protein Mp_5g01140 [Marchantia polymorpha subsp. ruderalis]BBN10115.1 hypothetical protein Mp_5g01140 [Marchantia polymorpha subsp. ruderalis]|eukprot:PTQ27456.1 hypothetical protein MARPO_0197s0008 [Marchantia polymorpha]
MEDKSWKKEDEFTEFRHQSVQSFLETIVKHQPHLKPDRLFKILARSRKIERRIFKSANNQDYHQKVSMNLYRLEKKNYKHRSAQVSQASSSTKLSILYESVSLAYVVQVLSLETEIKTTFQQPTNPQHKDKFQVAHNYRMKLPDARDVTHRNVPSKVLFENRDEVWPKLKQLRDLHFNELTIINEFLLERTKQKLHDAQMLQLIAWLELLRRILRGLSTPKEDLPKKFLRGTIHQLEKQIHDIVRIFRDSLAEISASIQDPDPCSGTSRIDSKSKASTSLSGEASSTPPPSLQSDKKVAAGYYFTATDAQSLRNISLRLLDLQLSREGKREKKPSTEEQPPDKESK